MKVSIVDILGTDRDIANAARTTISLEDTDKSVSSDYMRKLYLSEHSPIRIKQFIVLVEDIPYWVAMHFVRHNVGITHWVSTQRDDRTGEARGDQEAPVNWKFMANPNAIINISRRRLCNCAHPKTIEVWERVLGVIKMYDEALFSVCVPDCIYRGWCFEYKSCNSHKTKAFQQDLIEYRKNINGYHVPLKPVSPMDGIDAVWPNIKDIK